VQSVAVKLIVEREREIQNFKPEESWKIVVELIFNDTKNKEKYLKDSESSSE
jgi:DNA topoisomerase-1